MGNDGLAINRTIAIGPTWVCWPRVPCLRMRVVQQIRRLLMPPGVLPIGFSGDQGQGGRMMTLPLLRVIAWLVLPHDTGTTSRVAS